MTPTLPAKEGQVPLLQGVFGRPCSYPTAIIPPTIHEVVQWTEPNGSFPQQMESHYESRPRNKTTLPPIQRALKMMSRDVTGWQKKLTGDATGEQPASEAIGPHPQASFHPPTTASMLASNAAKPTCSLNLICYRPGSQGCVLRQIRVISRAKFAKVEDYSAAIEANDGIVSTDKEFFELLWKKYNERMCSFWRRYLSLKTLRRIRLLSVSLSACLHHTTVLSLTQSKRISILQRAGQ